MNKTNEMKKNEKHLKKEKINLMYINENKDKAEDTNIEQ